MYLVECERSGPHLEIPYLFLLTDFECGTRNLSTIFFLCDVRKMRQVWLDQRRQLRALLEGLDVACGVAVTSTNGERSMRPRGREVEKSVGRVHALSGNEEIVLRCKRYKNGITQEEWTENSWGKADWSATCLLYTSPSPRD